MATRLGLCLSVLLSALLLTAGCQSDMAADSVPPVYHPVTAQQPAVAPQPQQYTYIAPAPVRHVTPVEPVRPPAEAGGWSNVPASWIPPVPARPWKWIVIHHTATSFGNAAIVTRWHLARGFDEMGYHFLIGNGTDSGDGQVEVGTRWPKQKWGAHTKTPDNQFNDFGIGICLVGNFDITHPSQAQIRSLDHLVAYLMFTYHIPPDHVLGHDNCKPTDCPGRYMNVAAVRRSALQILADGGDHEFDNQPTALAAGTELMHDYISK
jgi:hypothetical protein